MKSQPGSPAVVRPSVRPSSTGCGIRGERNRRVQTTKQTKNVRVFPVAQRRFVLFRHARGTCSLSKAHLDRGGHALPFARLRLNPPGQVS